MNQPDVHNRFLSKNVQVHTKISLNYKFITLCATNMKFNPKQVVGNVQEVVIFLDSTRDAEIYHKIIKPYITSLLLPPYSYLCCF